MNRPKPAGFRMEFCCLVALCLAITGCSSGSNSGGPGTLSLSLSSSMALAPQDGTPAKITATVSGNPGAVTFSVSGLPSGTVSNVAQQSGSSNGAITLTSTANTPAGTYTLKITATDGAGSSTSQDLTLVVAVAGVVGATPDQTQGVNGKLQQFMSTSFQPAEWDYQFFQLNPAATTALGNLQPQHIRLQGVSQGVPQGSEGTTSTAWDFTILDDVTQPVLRVGDHSPEFQIAKAPAFMYVNNDSSSTFVDLTFKSFAAYAANLVWYYNKGGFRTPDNVLHVSPAYPNEKITWWGIYNEPSINNNLDATQYTTMYNALVPAMQSVDSSLKFVGLELCCSSEDWAKTFAANVTAQVDAVAAHYYSSCNQKDTDADLFATVPGFASSVQTIHSNLVTNPQLAGVPVWVTENNVNADFDKGGGISNCNGTTFVPDLRGTSAFFAAWRPFVFSQLGKAGNQALYHWDYDADAQFGEVDYNTGSKHLSYWVDYWLAQMYPQTPTPPDILSLTITETATVETLATKNSDGSVLLMVADRAVLSPSDNNGSGDARTVILDLSALGNFTSASQLNIGATSELTNGPQATSITLAPKLTVTLPGYSVSFLLLKP
ncbi:MAG TPA: glycosyl hydrolase [Candidatus Acidoferrum sp.]|nr:glycosyl hydrolase [Candidatus Acidoferrum sp.]